ncbi:hypothetical protein HK102_010189 [Quaeritorhiza haematococci]|nr:hypothetical protein HK102_010189 [Quaeritorhiza haematococci]
MSPSSLIQSSAALCFWLKLWGIIVFQTITAFSANSATQWEFRTETRFTECVRVGGNGPSFTPRTPLEFATCYSSLNITIPAGQKDDQVFAFFNNSGEVTQVNPLSLPTAWFNIRPSFAPELCLGVQSADVKQGLGISLEQCDLGAGNQRFRPVDLKDGFYALIIAHSGMCVARRENKLVQDTCITSSNNRFRFIEHDLRAPEPHGCGPNRPCPNNGCCTVNGTCGKDSRIASAFLFSNLVNLEEYHAEY